MGDMGDVIIYVLMILFSSLLLFCIFSLLDILNRKIFKKTDSNFFKVVHKLNYIFPPSILFTIVYWILGTFFVEFFSIDYIIFCLFIIFLSLFVIKMWKYGSMHEEFMESWIKFSSIFLVFVILILSSYFILIIMEIYNFL